MGLFDSVFAPNTGWLGLPQQPPDEMTPSNAQNGTVTDFLRSILPPGTVDRMANLGPQMHGIIGNALMNTPQLAPFSIGGNIHNAITGAQSLANPQKPPPSLPPLDEPRNIGAAPGMNAPSSPQGFGPTLDERAYGMSGAPQPPMSFASQGGAPQLPPQAANAMAQAPQKPEAGLGDRLSAGFQGFANGGAPLPALANLIGGIATGQRQDKAGQALQNQEKMAAAVYGALTQRGIPHEQAVGIAQAAATDPKLAESLLPQALGLKPPATMEGVIAEQTYNAGRGRNSAGGGQAGSQSAATPMATYEDFVRRKNAAEKAGTTEGERVANAQLDLPTSLAQANEALRLTNELRTHKGREGNAWWHTKVGAYLPDASIPGNTDARDAIGLLNQSKGGAFLEAFKALKGGGQITEIEGKKATDAIARMDRSQSKAEFDKALSDYEGVIKLGVDRANQLAGKPAPGGFQGNSGWQQVKPGVRIRQVQ